MTQLKQTLLGYIFAFNFVFLCQYIKGHHLTFGKFHVFKNEHLWYGLTDCLSAHASPLFSASADVSNELQCSGLHRLS